MSRCRNNTLISKIGMKTLTKTTEVDFAVLTDLESCIKVNTRNYLSYDGSSATFNVFQTPDDMFSCLPEGCKNSGTLTVAGSVDPVSATFAVRADATEFPAGVITYYVYLPTAGTYTLETIISDIVDQSQENAYVYEKSLVAMAPGFHPVVVDLSEVPDEVRGDGWVEPSTNGIILTLRAGEGSGLNILSTIGFSSVYIYHSIEDFEVNDTIKVGCIDEFSGEFTMDPRDASCFAAGYDPESIAIERTITAKSVTPNYWKLNPLTKSRGLTTGWIPQTVEMEVRLTEDECYGYVQLPDMNMEECSFLLITRGENCNITDAMLNRVSTLVPVGINERQFIVLDPMSTEAGKILFHDSLVGEKVIVSYPKAVDVEHFVGNDHDLDARRVRMSIVKEQTDGVLVNYVYNNVLVTSFPDTINNEETTFDFTIAVQRDRNGNFYEMFKVVN